MARAPEMGDACRPGGSCPDCNPKPKQCAWLFCEAPAEEDSDYCADCREAGDEYVADLAEDDKPWSGVVGI